MDKSWMSAHTISSKYVEGVESFINFAILNSTKLNLIRCPCIKCGNLKFLDPKTIKDHLFVNGVLESYTTWFWHGETSGRVHVEGDSESSFEYGGGLDAVDMVEAIFREYDNKPNSFIKILADAEKPLYSECSTHTVLSTLMRLYNLKAKHGWSDNSFSKLLSLLVDVLPDPNEIPRSSYEVKKTLSSLGMDYKKIHACPNDFIKRKFMMMMLTLLISGPKQPGNDIDVYLAPLIDDLKELWQAGVDAYDAYRDESFNLRAVFWHHKRMVRRHTFLLHATIFPNKKKCNFI
ncbi:hypothetical protein UlMin_001756 [Ulmus minor]